MSDSIRRLAQQALANKVSDFLDRAPEELMMRFIVNDAESSYDFTVQERRVKFGWTDVAFRWEPGERAISKDSEYSYKYARDFVKDRWEQGEESILRDAYNSYLYARDVIKARWERAEPLIVTDGSISLKYARDVVKARWEPGEDSISKNGRLAYEYAAQVLKSRFIPGEDAISEDTELMYEYAKDVCKGRLPDALHNKMVMLSYSDQADEYVKKYCGAKKYMVKRRRRAS